MKQQEKILVKLSKLEILNRNQLCQLLNVGVRRINVLMQELKREGYIVYIEHEKGRIYKLSKKGAALVGVDYIHGWSMMEHRLMRNWLLLREREYKLETQVKVGNVSIVPDAIVMGSVWKFVEVDRKQKWRANEDKLQRYSELKKTKAFQKKYGHFPTLIWVVEMESRVKKLKDECKRLGLHCEVYTTDEIRG